MLTDPIRESRWSIDSPWGRLRWTLPAALLISAAVLWALAYFMERPASEQMASAPIDARFIEQPKAEPAAARPRPLPARPQRVPKQQPRSEHIEKAQPVRKAEAAPAAPVALPAAPSEGEAKAGIDQAGTVSGPASSGGARGTPGPAFGGNDIQTGSGGGKGTPGGSMYASSGARAITRPMPQIPDDLREQAFNFAALARFHVAADGSAEVDSPGLRRIHVSIVFSSTALRNGGSCRR